MSTVLYTCPRCNGAGSVSFRHVANGRCFACQGSGKLRSTAKALSDAERAGMEYQQACAEAQARAASDAQMRFLSKLAIASRVCENDLICVANGYVPGRHCPEGTKAEVSKALSMFKNMPSSQVYRVCRPGRNAA